MDAAPRKAYPSDLTDEQWEYLQIVIPDAKPGGRPRATDMREVVNALLYQNRSGCQWDMLPHDLPPKSTVYDYFAAWRGDGTWQVMLDVLREGYRATHAASGEATPSAASIDSQTAMTRMSVRACRLLAVSRRGSGRSANTAVIGSGIGRSSREPL